MIFLRDINGDYINADYVVDIGTQTYGKVTAIEANVVGKDGHVELGAYLSKEAADTALKQLMNNLAYSTIAVPAPDHKIIAAEENEALPDGLKSDIDNISLSVHTYNVLKRAGVRTLEDLAEMTMEELRAVRNIGKKSLEEVIATAAKYGITFKENSNEQAD